MKKLFLAVMSIVCCITMMSASSKQQAVTHHDAHKNDSSNEQSSQNEKQDNATVFQKNHPSFYPIDTIKVVIYSEEGSDIITQSDINRPSLDGNFKALDDIVLERLIYLDAKRFKIMPDEETVDKHLKAVQRENNLTLDQLKAIFKAAGYTYEEGRNEFMIMTTINSMLDFRIRSRLIVPEKDILAYYNAHKEVEPAAYFLERAFFEYPADNADREVLRQELDELASHDSIVIAWAKPFWINKGDLAEDKQPIIAQLKMGEIAGPIETETGFELFKLNDRREEKVIPLEKRYNEIGNILRKPRYEALMNEYKQQLLTTASIIYF